ncbi:CRP-like cAMP-binding protein [Listeria rocourtiae]|uniref:CRP-like cAMP-binding protein n=2 Tax=Listeria rocourtiae TaxID=647910 RepID=A0A4R6ZK98_9LIST|nr:CRP-like cAMP-binding protein [Listeria rocourtiae]
MQIRGISEENTMYKMKKIIHLKKNESLPYPGDYIVHEGFLACKTAEQLVYFAKPGDAIVSLSNSCGRLLQFQAKTDVILVRMPKESLLITLERQDAMKEKLIQALVMRVQFFSVPAKDRLFVLLYQLGKEIGVQIGADYCIPSVVTQKEMGDYVSCTREYLCLVKKQLIEEGWLKEERGWKLLEWERWESEFGKIV